LSIFFATVGIELLLGACSMLYWRGFGAERYVPTTTFAKPPQPHWGGYKDKATFVLPLHDGDAWTMFRCWLYPLNDSRTLAWNMLPCRRRLRLFGNPNETLN